MAGIERGAKSKPAGKGKKRGGSNGRGSNSASPIDHPDRRNQPDEPNKVATVSLRPLEELAGSAPHEED